jgi:TPR repeat protein
MGGREISPGLQQGFNWTAQDSDSQYTVSFHFPPTFNLNCVKLDFTQRDGGAIISVNIPNSPPLLAGVLYGDATEAILRSDESDSKVVATITKAAAGEWPFPIKSPGPNTLIDPQSAFTLGLYLSAHGGSPQEQESGVHLVDLSMQLGYPPALFHVAESQPPEKVAVRLYLLQMAAERYNFPPAICRLLLFNVASDPTFAADGLRTLEQFAEKGVVEAHESLAYLLSPASGVPCASKDRAAAMRHIDAVLDADESNMAMTIEKAKLLFTGSEGVPQDAAAARSIYARALAVGKQRGVSLPELEQLVAGEQNGAAGKSWFFWAVGAVAALVFGLAVFRHFRRQSAQTRK